MKKINLVAFCGSLRKNSYNMVALEALMQLAPEQCEVTLADISTLPLFNPDLEDENLPAVSALKQLVGNAEGFIIASPEYAHGISGPMKNALDWLVSGTEFPYKPIMLINTSPRASHAQAQIKEVLKTMSGIIVDDAGLTLPLLGSRLMVSDIVNDALLSHSIQSGLLIFMDAILAEV